MDVEILAEMTGFKRQSVVEHRQVQGAHILRIDLNADLQLRRLCEKPPVLERRLPDGDRFETDFLLDGAVRSFTAQHMDKQRTHNFVGPDDRPTPAWVLRAEAYPPGSLFGAAVERIMFVVLDQHSGAVYDLSTPNDSLQRPWVSYGLGFVHESGWLNFVWTNPVSGTLEVNHDLDGENSMHLAGAFSSVRCHMPNCHEHFEQAPDREFVVELPIGFYALTGKWSTPLRK